MRRSSRLAVPLKRPEDVVPHLGKAIHWKEGRSAKALADSWFYSKDIPTTVRGVLDQAPELKGAELLDGWLERETDLGDSRGTPSQTDLLALLGLDAGLAVLGVEAKVDESFGPIVSQWLGDGSGGKPQRLERLCALFDVQPYDVGVLRYQLFHRTAAAILEARRFRTDRAVFIVQSFCANASGLADTRDFLEVIGLPGLAAGMLVGPRHFGEVALWVGWAADTAPGPRMETAR